MVLTGSTACPRVAELLPGVVYSCDPVRMELLAGARDAAEERRLLTLLARTTMLPLTSRDDDMAAVLYRTCRRNGETVQKLVGCLIAAVAMGAEVPLLHADADVDVLARHTALVVDGPDHPVVSTRGAVIPDTTPGGTATFTPPNGLASPQCGSIPPPWHPMHPRCGHSEQR